MTIDYKRSTVNVSIDTFEGLLILSIIVYTIRLNLLSQKYQDWNNIDFGQMEDGHSLIEDLSQLIGEMDYEERFMTGHKLNDMLLSCSFAGYPCGPM